MRTAWIAALTTITFGCGSPTTHKAQPLPHKAEQALPGWIPSVTGAATGTAPRWQVVQDGEREVLAQLESGGDRGDFPVCLRRGSSFRDGKVRVWFKPISGDTDQAGGVVFRARDEGNFYIARANALEDNVSIYCTEAGERRTIHYWQDVPVQLDEWHELVVEARAFTFKVWLDGEFVGQIEDTKRTFADAGMVGVWTKADSVTYFRDLTSTTGL